MEELGEGVGSERGRSRGVDVCERERRKLD